MKNLKKVTKEIFIISMISMISMPHNVFAEALDDGKSHKVFVNYKKSDLSGGCDRIRGCDYIGDDSQDASPIFDGGSSEQMESAVWTPDVIAQVVQQGDRRTDLRCMGLGLDTTSMSDPDARIATAQVILGRVAPTVIGSQVTANIRNFMNRFLPQVFTGVSDLIWVTYMDGGMELFSYNISTLTIQKSITLVPSSGKFEPTSKCNMMG